MDDDEKKTTEQEMDEVLKPEDSEDTSTSTEEQDADAETGDGEEQEQESTGSKRLDKAREKRPNMNIDRILDRMRSQDSDPISHSQTQQTQETEPYKPLQYNEGEYTTSQLEQDRQAYAKIQRDTGAQEGFNRGLSQYKLDRFADNLELDAERIGMKYPELDPDSDEFDSTRADRLNRMYYNFIGYNEKTGRVQRTDVRYKDFIDGMLVLADDIATNRSSQTVKNVAKQAARAGVRPSGGTAKTGRVNLNDVESISKMSREDFKKNRDALNKKALELLANE